MRTFAALLLVLLTACATRGVERERFDQPGEADAYFIAKRGITDDASLRYAAARTQLEKMSRNRIASDANGVRNFRAWTFLGPGNIGGRTRSLLIDPTNPRVMYAGTVSGGVFKTSDGGERWNPLTDALANLSIGAMAMDPKDTNTIYAGTGEGYFREDVRGTATPIRGNGIFATHDGGSSWIQLTTTNDPDFQWVNDLVVSAHDSRRVYAATRSGVLRSNDGGINWTRVLPVTVKGGCFDLALRAGADGDEFLASCGTFEQATVYRNAHAESESSWDAVLSPPGMGRTSLAFAPSDSSIVYALAASNDPGPGGHFAQGGLLGVFRSDDGGRTWSPRATNADANRVNTVLLSNPLSALAPCDGTVSDSWVSMGWHCNVIVVDPLDPNRVWAAGVDLFRSDDGGRNWSIASYWWPDETEQRASYVHADQHVIVFDPAYDGVANQTMFAANDGGVYRTDNARATLRPDVSALCDLGASGVHFVSLNHNFGATQFYHGTVFPDGRHWLGGAQDNGTVFGDSSSGIDGWTMPVGGDGGFGAVDPIEPRFIYTQWQNASLVRSTDGGKSWSGARTGINDNFLFIAPLLLDPNERTRLWVGGRRLWRSTNQAGSWNATSPILDSMISAIAIAPNTPQVAVIGTTSGAILRTSNALQSSVNWLTITPRAGFISSITFDPTNTSTIYATYANFGGAHVWKSLDGGVTWNASDGSGVESIPDIPVHSLLVDPQQPSRLFLGTDLGIFVSTDAGGHWSVESSFPSVITETLVFGQGEYGRALYAFTHGRGAWRAELEQPATPRRRVAQ
ncbi:MAG: hypothetical protein QOI24_1900 [Acidobacteriota bacterium]|jgi:photosystem II stability/assembly factor-like uncharacterized protein|nr:hypothetical protein [Acidobacteriota bacterium]